VVGAEAVRIAGIPRDELRFEQRELADIVERGGRAGAADLDGEQVRAVGGGVRAVLLVAVGAGEVQRVADARAGLEVEFLGELGAVELVAPFLHRRAAGARVDAQHVGFVVRDDHEVVGQRDGGRCVGRAFGGARIGREPRLGDELAGLGGRGGRLRGLLCGRLGSGRRRTNRRKDPAEP